MDLRHAWRAENCDISNGLQVEGSVDWRCLQGGVLSPLWSLVVDFFLAWLNGKGLYTQGYTDALALLITEKFPSTVRAHAKGSEYSTELVQGQGAVSLDKMELVLFTKRKEVDMFIKPWREHVKQRMSKAYSFSWLCHQTLGKTWGLKPKVVH
jgi:hypothetical protein